jgi:hypothetical protein
VSRALHRSVAGVLARTSLLRQLAVRGVLVTLLPVAGVTLPGIVLLSAGQAPPTAGAGVALIATGTFLARFTAVRCQAALVVAADAVLDRRSISSRRALTAAGARWKDLVGLSLIELAPGWLLRLIVDWNGQPRDHGVPPPWSAARSS